MSGKINRIDKILRDYQYIISSALNLNIEIIDRGSIERDCVYGNVIITKKELIYKNYTSKSCDCCKKNMNCLDKFIIAVPIIYKGIIEGIVSIKSINEDDKIYLEENLEDYIKIATYIAEYISMKLSKYEDIDLEEEDRGLTSNGWKVIRLDDITGSSEAMIDIKNKTKKIAKSDSTVLITGDSGTGKELIARAIHTLSNRHTKPFIAINCAAIPDSLLESELFGYNKGAFSGANNSGKVGKFELANGGIIFLDEIGDMPLNLQSKLLRVLQERKFARLGSNKLIDLDIRIITATHQDLLKLCNEGKFRKDLYYRINVIPINLPPLKDRVDDIKELISKLVKKKSKEFDINIESIDEEVIEKLLKYDWPGNVRELENSIEYMINMVEEDGIIRENMIPHGIEEKVRQSININSKQINDIEDNILDLNEIVPIKDLELIYINKLIDRYGDSTESKRMIANKLGIGLATLYRKIGK